MNNSISILVPSYPGGGVVAGHDITRIIVNGHDVDMRSLRAFYLTSHISDPTDMSLVYNPVKNTSIQTKQGYAVIIEAPPGQPDGVFINGVKIAGKGAMNRGVNGFIFRFNLIPNSYPIYTILFSEYWRKSLMPIQEYYEENHELLDM